MFVGRPSMPGPGHSFSSRKCVWWDEQWRDYILFQETTPKYTSQKYIVYILYFIHSITMKFRSPHGYLVHYLFKIFRLYPEEIQITKYRTHLSPLTRSLTGWGDGSGLLVDDALCSCLWRQKKKTDGGKVGSSTKRFVKLYAVRGNRFLVDWQMLSSLFLIWCLIYDRLDVSDEGL